MRPRDKRFSLQYTAQSPVGVRNAMFQKQPWLQKSLKDWQLTGTTQFQSGTPLTATVLGNAANAGAGVQGTVRADATGLPIDAGSGYFNPLAFSVPVAGTYGDAGRGTIPGPGQFTMGLQLARQIQLAERKSVEFNVQATNLLNHVNLSGYGTVVNSLNVWIGDCSKWDADRFGYRPPAVLKSGFENNETYTSTGRCGAVHSERVRAGSHV